MYHRADFIQSDPVQFPHRYTLKQDIEVSGLLTAIMSFGNRKQILKKAEPNFWDIWRREIFILLYLLSMGYISIVVVKIVHGKSILFLLRFAMEELMIKG